MKTERKPHKPPKNRETKRCRICQRYYTANLSKVCKRCLDTPVGKLFAATYRKSQQRITP